MDYKFEENIEELKCNKYFPLCIKEKEEKPVEDFVVYKSGNNQSFYIIDNYYKIENNENDYMRNLIIERRKHFCE